MGLRETIQSKQQIVATVAILVMIASAVIIWRGSGSRSSQAKQDYFYDLGTGKLFTASRTTVPPIDAPSGPGQGVKAYVYTCDASCTDNNLQVAALMTYSETAKSAMERVPETVAQMEQQASAPGPLVAIPAEDGDDISWVSANSAQGMAIMSRSNSLCNDQPAKACFPQ